MSAAPVIGPAVEVIEIGLDLLDIGHDFRIDDDPQALAELADSIAQIGIIQPLLVRATAAGWEVIAGRRRLAAARHAGLATVPCLERGYTDDEAVNVTLAENLHRRHLSPIEEGLAYQHLRERGIAVADIAVRVGRSTATVHNMLKVLTLPGETRDKIHRGQMSYFTALYPHSQKRSRRGDHSRPHGDESRLITHWRRRHDRLTECIRSILHTGKAKKWTGADVLLALEMTLKVDLKPLDEDATREAGGHEWEVYQRGQRR